MVISPRHAILMDSINQTYVVAIDGLVWRVTLIIFLVERKDIRQIPLKYPDPLTRPWKGIRVAYDKRTPEGLVPVETLVKTAFESQDSAVIVKPRWTANLYTLPPRGAGSATVRIPTLQAALPRHEYGSWAALHENPIRGSLGWT